MNLPEHNINLTWTYFDSIEALDAKKEMLSNCGGVYLWIAPLKTKRVLYIGTAKNFQKRLFDHLSNQVKGGYTEFFYDGFDDLLTYFSDEIYPEGRDKNYFIAKANLGGKFTFPIGPFHNEFTFRRIVPDQEKMNAKLTFINSLQFAVAPINDSIAGLSSEKVSEQVESILQTEISQSYVNILKSQYNRKISHLGMRGTKSNASLIGSILNEVTLSCLIHHTGDVGRLPQEVLSVVSSVGILTRR